MVLCILSILVAVNCQAVGLSRGKCQQERRQVWTDSRSSVCLPGRREEGRAAPGSPGALSSAPVCVLTKDGHITWQSRAQILGEVNRSEFKSKPCHLLAGRAGAEKPTSLSLSSLIHEVSIIAVPISQSLLEY